jgi:hypothetical protein
VLESHIRSECAGGGKESDPIAHQQRSAWEGLFAEEVAELWEPWMRVVDELLEDEELVDTGAKANCSASKSTGNCCA